MFGKKHFLFECFDWVFKIEILKPSSYTELNGQKKSLRAHHQLRKNIRSKFAWLFTFITVISRIAKYFIDNQKKHFYCSNRLKWSGFELKFEERYLMRNITLCHGSG